MSDVSEDEIDVLEAVERPEDGVRVPNASQAFAFHNERPLLAVGSLDGQVHRFVLDMENSDVKNVTPADKQPHQDSCRALAFDPEGTRLLTSSSDKSVCISDVETGRRIWRAKMSNGVNACYWMDQLAVGGDDEGEVALWDPRKAPKNFKACEIVKFSEQEDFITGFCHSRDGKRLVATSGDCYLAAYDLRWSKMNLYALSDQEDHEMVGVFSMRDQRHAVVGDQGGILQLWEWDNWGDYKDRIPGFGRSVECMAKVNENVLLVGSDDGFTRVVHLYPNRICGVVGFSEGRSPEALAVSEEAGVLAILGDDSVVRFHNLEEEVHSQVKKDLKKAKHKGPEMAGDSEDEDDPSEDENSDSESEAENKKKRRKRGTNRRAARQAANSAKKKERKKFFADL